MPDSIEQLPIYKEVRALEDQVYELVKALPADQFYGLGNDLRRSSAAVAHHVMAMHRLFSYRLKLDELVAARREAEAVLKYLDDAQRHALTDELAKGYTAVIRQSWELTKRVKAKLDERQNAA